MRHAFDADHIAAIDNTTRKLVGDGKRPVSVGLFFSLGHSTVVFLMAILVALGAGFVGTLVDEDSRAHETLGLIGTSVSGLFLMLIGVVNLLAFIAIAKVWAELRRGRYDDLGLEQALESRGLIARLLGPMLRSVTRPGQMYPIGFLFGLGFDTATEISILVLAGAGAATGLPWYAILVLPLLFAAGMSLFDTLDGAFMQVAYQWAFVLTGAQGLLQPGDHRPGYLVERAGTLDWRHRLAGPQASISRHGRLDRPRATLRLPVRIVCGAVSRVAGRVRHRALPACRMSLHTWINRDDDRATLSLADGQTLAADLVVCADGIRSAGTPDLGARRPTHATRDTWPGAAPFDGDRTQRSLGEHPAGRVHLPDPAAGPPAELRDSGPARLRAVQLALVSEHRAGRPAHGPAHRPRRCLGRADRAAGLGPDSPCRRSCVRRRTRSCLRRWPRLIQQTAEPFIQVIVDLEVRRMAFGRSCLIGACRVRAARRRIGVGTAKAADDAWQLGRVC